MLALEFSRLDARLDPGIGICTMRLCGGTLHEVCGRYGIQMEGQHRALFDARATAEVVLRALQEGLNPSSTAPANVFLPPSLPQLAFHTIVRDMIDTALVTHPLPRILRSVSYQGVNGPVMSYLDLLSRALDDLVITSKERQSLNKLGSDLGLTGTEKSTRA